MITKDILASIAVIIAITGYIPYIIDIHKGKTKPHLYSWSIWTLMAIVGALTQMRGGSGAGSWAGFTTAVIALYITIMAIFKGEKNITTIDRITATLSLIAFLTYYIAENHLAVIIIIVADLLAYTPTISKSYSKPYQETLTTYLLTIFKHLFSFFALSNTNFISAGYIIYLIIVNITFVSMLFIRRRNISKN